MSEHYLKKIKNKDPVLKSDIRGLMLERLDLEFKKWPPLDKCGKERYQGYLTAIDDLASDMGFPFGGEIKKYMEKVI